MDTMKLKKLMKQIEDAMTAVSFAEEGEFETAQSLIKEERRVLLALREGHIDHKTLTYALNACQRISAHLDILFITSPDACDDFSYPVLWQFESDLKTAGIRYRLIRKSGCLKQEIIDYTDKEHGVLFVIVESPQSLEAECRKKDSLLSDLWQKLKCPLVVVADQARA